MNCTCGAADAGLDADAHAKDCRIRTGFIPNTERPASARPSRYVAQRRRRSWVDRLRWRRPVQIGALNALGLGAFALAGAMLSPIVGVAIFGVSCIAFAWLLDDR